jgi:RNA polymerase sigma factor (sigma-70 family)
MILPGLSDFEIWSLFKKGDEPALSFIYTRHAEMLYRYGMKFTADGLLVEDTIQDLFTDLIRNRKTLGDTDNIQYYLLKSYKRNLFRKLQKAKKIIPEDNPETYSFEVTWSVEHDIIIDETASQKSKLLLKALDSLTPRQKEALYLRFTKELDYTEVAGLMDISVEACRNLISKAISTLKKWISEKGHGPTLFFVMVMK